VNNIPPKVCTYSCVYCQVGRTTHAQVERSVFYGPEDLVSEIRDKIDRARDVGESIDYITFVPDGEPTLDVNLGREIELLRPLDVKIAVISNASLVWRADVREDLARADWVSLKVDTTAEAVWRKIDRPHHSLRLETILDGVLAFAEEHRGKLVTETMLVQDLNDSAEHVEEVAGFLGGLGPRTVYVSIPTRPPTEAWVRPPEGEVINRAFQILSGRVGAAELLIGYEGNAFAFTGDVEEDLLSITAVHPMSEEAVGEFLAKAHTDDSVVLRLVDQGRLIRTIYRGKAFYLRALPSRNAS